MQVDLEQLEQHIAAECRLPVAMAAPRHFFVTTCRSISNVFARIENTKLMLTLAADRIGLE